jgi:hypothetical protein
VRAVDSRVRTYNRSMQAAFPIVVFGAVGLSVVMSIVFLLSKGSMYDEIGSGGLPGEGETPDMGVMGGSPYGAAAPDYDSIARSPELQGAEREQEIRQMLQARSERAVRRGEPPLDVDAEVARLTAAQPASTGHDPGIAEEVLQLVVARNERRERQGLEPLDLEAEVARTLAELDPG